MSSSRAKPSKRSHIEPLSSRWGEALLLNSLDHWPEGWTPAPRDCHGSAERWVAAHPGWSVVRGWVLVQGTPGQGATYAAHSAVMDPEGRLWEVTQPEQPALWFLED